MTTLMTLPSDTLTLTATPDTLRLPDDYDKLSFEHDLMHAYTPVVGRLQYGEKSIDDILGIVRSRIDAETQYSNSLQKIMERSLSLMEFSKDESLNKHGLDALICDLKQEYTQRMEYLASLQQDVQKPLIDMKEYYTAQNKIFANKTKNSIKILKDEQHQFMKLKAKYNKLLNSANDTKSKKDAIKTAKKRVNGQRSKWKQHEQVFEMDIGSTLQEMEQTELKRMKTLRDAFTNWSAFITNLCANRMYDIRDLAKSMSLIDVDNDLQCFMQNALKQSQPQRSMSTGNVFSLIPDLSRRQSDATVSFVHTYFNRYHRRTPSPSKDFSISTMSSPGVLSRWSSTVSIDSLPDVPDAQ